MLLSSRLHLWRRVIMCANHRIIIKDTSFPDMEQQRKQTELDKKLTEDLVRERDMLSKVKIVVPLILIIIFGS